MTRLEQRREAERPSRSREEGAVINGDLRVTVRVERRDRGAGLRPRPLRRAPRATSPVVCATGEEIGAGRLSLTVKLA
jgi:hypothetical protein